MKMFRFRALISVGLISIFFSAAGVAGPSAKLSVSTTPKSKIYVDGKFVGSAPLKKLAVMPGEHLIRYHSEKQGSRFEFSLSFKAEKHMICSYNFSTGENHCSSQALAGAHAMGKVSFGADVMAEIEVDGMPVGKTPLEKYELSTGKHTVKFLHPKFKPITQEVDVMEGQHIQVDVEFQAKEGGE